MYDGIDPGEPAPQPTPAPKKFPVESAMIRDRPNWLLRLIGAKFREDRGWRFSWGEWTRRWGLALELINWGEDGDWSVKVLPVCGAAYIKLPFLPQREPQDTMDSWGFSWNWDADNHGADIHLNWGARCRIVHLPWDRVHVRSDMLCDDGIWRKAIGSWEWKEGDPVKAVEKYPYRYVCRNGTVQDDIEATISVGEMEWRWRALRWWPFWPRLVRRTIDIEFSAEVGERRGSWKGGCTGCSYQMRRDETPHECLRRMQHDRRFD